MTNPPPEALDALYPQVYNELRRLAHDQRARQGSSETLNTTAVVHEAYLRLVDSDAAVWSDRPHFLALAARAMRYVLVDHARARVAGKRGGGARAVSFDEDQLAPPERAEDLIAVDEALTRLEGHDARLAQLVQLRFYAGLTYEEIADVVSLSVPTVKRDWARARSWLYRFVTEADGQP